ncbi:general secretion pathway protein D [Ralstonia sp. 25mfcol4.1]|uniref:secretin N-terminal domain-containing protein n=1 Tax=Burkholderiaceae TaxID=119060 RepID=UPI0008857277|nr:secretin N-terminal domain-containing protein [Ralstonia sp. 25mfcol4.1]SDP80399.1 general secretion pathway protein D [Ralstonia sp. 25mfcol4.1]
MNVPMQLSAMTVSALLLAGCAALPGPAPGAAPHPGAALEKAAADAVAAPDDVTSQLRYRVERERRIWTLVQQGAAQLDLGNVDAAAASFAEALSIDPANARALEGAQRAASAQPMAAAVEAARAQAKADVNPAGAIDTLNDALATDARHAEARALRDELVVTQERQRGRPARTLAASLRQPISVQFRDQPLSTVLTTISTLSKLSFVLDKDVPQDLRATVSANDTSVEAIVDLVLATNHLEKKILNDTTLLIYPKVADKQQQYRDLTTRTFYLSNADPKQVMSMIKQIVKTKDVYVDERLGMLVVRDTPEAVEVAERLVIAHDLPQSEVMFDVQILEVNNSDALNLGIRYPSSISASVAGAAGKAGTLTWNELRHLNGDKVGVNLGDPVVTANLARETGQGQLLANPRIRVKNREKAKIMIGDRLPVVTTVNGNGVVTESVSYQDVGLQLDVTPTLSQDGEISVKVALEVSNVVSTIKTQTGLMAYQIGTRKAETNMTARDGETQVLAGLINRNEQARGHAIPGLGDIPILDRVFGTRETKTTTTELVLLITPRIVRNLPVPAAHVTEFNSGPQGAITTAPLVLQPAPAAAPRVPAKPAPTFEFSQ